MEDPLGAEIIKKYAESTHDLDALCIRKGTAKTLWLHRRLCELTNILTYSAKEKARDDIRRAAGVRLWLTKNAPTKKPTEVILIIRGQDNSFYQLIIPQSFNENQTLKVKIKNRTLTLEAIPKSNGYNTEYRIIDESGSTYEQMALLYSTETHEWLEKKKLTEQYNKKTANT